MLMVCYCDMLHSDAPVQEDISVYLYSFRSFSNVQKISKENTRSNKLKEVDLVGLSSRIVFASLVVVRCGSDNCLKCLNVYVYMYMYMCTCICLNVYVIMS